MTILGSLMSLCPAEGRAFFKRSVKDHPGVTPGWISWEVETAHRATESEGKRLTRLGGVWTSSSQPLLSDMVAIRPVCLLSKHSRAVP